MSTITVGLEFNFDMAAAPRGQFEESELPGRGQSVRKVRRFVKQYVLVGYWSSTGPYLVFTYRTEPSKDHPTGYWAGLHTAETGYCWAYLPEPPTAMGA